jgi:peptide subunit release factor 1 (eRF1)
MKELTIEMINRHLDELTAFEPNGFPFVSLYLNAQADQHGRDNFQPFVRKELTRRARTFPVDSIERVSFERDAARIEKYLESELRASANGLAIFAGAGADNYFKAIQLAAPIETNELHVSERPHLYPLALLADQYPRYIALIADTDTARLFVFDLGRTKYRNELDNSGGSFAPDGEHSHLRYRRRLEKHNLRHAKQAVEMLERAVREESAKNIVLVGDEIIIPLLRKQLPAYLAERVVDVLRLDIRTPEHEVLRATMNALREDNIQTDAEKVRNLLDENASGGLSVVGLDKTMSALARGQVSELVLNARNEELRFDGELPGEIGISPNENPGTISNEIDRGNEPPPEMIVDALISLARSTGAPVTFIEDAALLSDVGGVGAFFMYRIYAEREEGG